MSERTAATIITVGNLRVGYLPFAAFFLPMAFAFGHQICKVSFASSSPATCAPDRHEFSVDACALEANEENDRTLPRELEIHELRPIIK